MKQKTVKKSKSLNMALTLILFALVPLLVAVIVIGSILISTSSKELKSTTHNALVESIVEVGVAFDYSTESNEQMLKNFIKAPIVQEFLKNPTDPTLKAKAQAYTVEVYGGLEGWEGIYLADWNSQVLTHPAEAVVGRVMREGDRLKELQDAMLAADGVYNVGIITSPASGQLIMSMYLAIFDDAGNPIGYVGAGTFVNNIASKFSDVASLDVSSAYVYFVDSTGTMLYHPDETKIGNPVENAAVKGIIAKLEAGESPSPEAVEYEYKGATKYAAYYVGKNNAYVAVLTADESDVLSEITTFKMVTVIVAAILIALFAVIAVFAARIVTLPLKKVTDSLQVLSTGDVTVECKTNSVIKEIKSIIDAFNALKGALMTSMTNVKESAESLNSAIISVDEMTADNVESISQINVAIDEVASTSQSVAENAQVMAEKAAELGMNIETMNTNISGLFDESVKIREANEEATECMRSVYSGAIESVEAVQSIADRIAETNNAITEISAAIQAIESIAAQTNLLSLNASIEAARAGEAGRGFAVVADEIRTLADSSAASAKEIKQIIENVIALSGNAVEISNRVSEVISREQSDIETTQAKFTILSESVEASIEEIQTIKEMATRLDVIKVDLANATTDLGAISEELGASSEEVAASCQTVTGACTDTQASTEEMRAINEHMVAAVDFFKLS